MSQKQILKIKQQLRSYILGHMEYNGYNQTQFAEVLDITQPRLNLLIKNRLGSFSINSLLTYLMQLEYDIEIIIK